MIACLADLDALPVLPTALIAVARLGGFNDALDYIEHERLHGHYRCTHPMPNDDGFCGWCNSTGYVQIEENGVWITGAGNNAINQQLAARNARK